MWPRFFTGIAYRAPFGSLAKDHRAVDCGRWKTVGTVEGEVVIRWSAGAAASRAWFAETATHRGRCEGFHYYGASEYVGGESCVGSLAASAANGTAILTREASLRGRLASFRERDRSASDLRNSLIRIAGELSRKDLVDEPFDAVLKSLVEQVQANVTRLTALQAQKSVASQSLQTVLSTDQRRTIVSGELSKARDKLIILKAAVAELEKLKAQAKIVGETAQSARTSIVRRVFNNSLNKLWRDLFIRLAPTEPFVPAFKVPETDFEDFASSRRCTATAKKEARRVRCSAPEISTPPR